LIDFDFWCFNATFSNISAISLRPVLVVEEAGIPREKFYKTFTKSGANPRRIGDRLV
jgi:DNA-binding phage protein